MKKSWKKLEKVIKLIEDTLKDSPHTVIYTNHKIKNSGGRFREFDVFIESKVSGHDINIAIECKDYKSKVSAEKIEAFETKCRRIPAINKKIFIASKGFQAEARNVAKDCGIELKVASKLDPNQILNWFPIIRLDIKLLSGGNAQVFLDVEEEHLKEVGLEPKGSFFKNNSPITLNDYILEFYKDQRHSVNNFSLLRWMKLDSKQQRESFPVNLRIETHDLFYSDKKKSSIKVTGIEATLIMKLEHILVQPIESYTLTDLDGKLQAETLTIHLEDGGKANFVRTPDNKTNMYIDDPDGKLRHLKFITSYARKSDKFND